LSLPWPLILWAALILNTAAGLRWSRITAPVRVTAYDVPLEYQPIVAEVLGSAQDTPQSRVEYNEIGFRISSLPMLRTAQFASNVFGRGALHVDNYRPVAQIQGRMGLALADDGSVFETTEFLGYLPVLLPPDGWDRPGSVLISDWERADAALLALQVMEKLPERSWTIAVAKTGHFSIESEGVAEVYFCTSFGLVDKMDQLVAKVADSPELLLENSRITVLGGDYRIAVVPR
jgi:hypothetical protein